MHKKILLPILSLILAAVILLGAYNGLNGVRADNREAELQAKMETILPGSTTFTPEEYTGEDANIVSIHKGETGFVIETKTYGYAGDITMLIGVSNEGKVTGISVISHTETPGLGAVAADAGPKGEAFRSQFVGGDGIVSKGVENTIRNVSYVASEGMRKTDSEIIKIMFG